MAWPRWCTSLSRAKQFFRTSSSRIRFTEPWDGVSCSSSTTSHASPTHSTGHAPQPPTAAQRQKPELRGPRRVPGIYVGRTAGTPELRVAKHVLKDIKEAIERGDYRPRYGGLDTYRLTRTGRWKDPDLADRYKHTMASADARRANLVPVPIEKRRKRAAK